MRLQHLPFVIAGAICAAPTMTHAQFIGTLTLTPKGCEATGQCTLVNKLRFVDSQGEIWEAAAGLPTDGASIPGVFQPFVGDPFDEAFIRAAVVHDHYCDRHVKPWRRTHRMFYEALLDQGVSSAKAKTMYLAVFVGGPKWIKLIPGNNCGKGCVNAKTSLTGVSGFGSRAADYSIPGLQEELKRTYAELSVDPNAMTLDQIEKRAMELRPGDYYFKNGDSVVVTTPVNTE